MNLCMQDLEPQELEEVFKQGKVRTRHMVGAAWLEFLG